jgi:hypothetical protein
VASSDLPAVAEAATLAKITLASPRRLTAGYTVSALGALLVLVFTTGWWLIGAVSALLGALMGGTVLPVVALALAGMLIGRGWVAMLQSLRARMRSHDLSDVAALPDAVARLSPPLQRLVRHTRTVVATLADEELTGPARSRELYDWVTTLAELGEEDTDYLADRRLHAAAIRPQVLAVGESLEARARAIDLLERFEQRLLSHDGDPFRG